MYVRCLEKVLATPPLNGLILPGITRQSILELVKEWDEFRVEERNFTIDELIELNKNEKVSPRSTLAILFVKSRRFQRLFEKQKPIFGSLTFFSIAIEA